MQTPQAILDQTHSLAGRIRIVQIERIDASGASTHFGPLDIASLDTLRQIARRITEEPNLFAPRMTDNGLRFTCEWQHATWYIYSY